MQGLEAHGRISPTGFYGEKLWCPGLRRRESVELWNCSASVKALVMHPPVVVQVIFARGASPSAARCAQLVARPDVWGQIVEASVHDLRLDRRQVLSAARTGNACTARAAFAASGYFFKGQVLMPSSV